MEKEKFEEFISKNASATMFECYEEGYKRALEEIDGSTSDGYHTFDELYEYRMVYNAMLVNSLNLIPKRGLSVVKSKRHSDGGLCFDGGWFVVVIESTFGQITNHYELRYWDLFKCKEVEQAPEWDGHTPQDALNRMYLLNEDLKKSEVIDRKSIYKHSKTGKYYMFVSESENTETGEMYVVYVALYGDNKCWSRPKDMFFDEVEIDGVKVKRFVNTPDDVEGVKALWKYVNKLGFI